jgi:cyclopropane fatty-acyl-phospholipid synthase-like methyltransferase
MSEKSQKEVAEYYNKLWLDLEKESKNKPNDRHYKILKELKNSGLKKSHIVLEIGCGIGTLSRMLSQYLSSGTIKGLDISDETIKFNQENYTQFKNLNFEVADFRKYTDTIRYDFIVFPDVLEHIPTEMHPDFFSKAFELLKEDGVVFINIPHPFLIEYCSVHRPEALQIIDQPLWLNKFSESIYNAGFIIEKVQSYSLIFQQYDYQYLVVKKKNFYTSMEKMSKYKIFIQRLYNRFL